MSHSPILPYYPGTSPSAVEVDPPDITGPLTADFDADGNEITDLGGLEFRNDVADLGGAALENFLLAGSKGSGNVAPGQRTSIIEDDLYNGFGDVVETSDGRLVCCFRSAASHFGFDGVMKRTESSDGGATWSTPTTILDLAPLDVRGVCLAMLSDGRIALSSWSRNTALDTFAVFVMFSTDDGATFGAPVTVNTGFTVLKATEARVIERTDGALLLATYGNNTTGGDGAFVIQGPTTTAVSISTDDGVTWSRLAVIAAPDGLDARHYNECQIGYLGDGTTLMALIRQDFYQAKIVRCTSTNGGVTWSSPVSTGIPAIGQRPAWIRMASGAIVLQVRNSSGSANLDFGIATSWDEGVTWATPIWIMGDATSTYGGFLIMSPNILGAVVFSERSGTIDTSPSDGWFQLFYDGTAVTPEGKLTGAEFETLLVRRDINSNQYNGYPMVRVDNEDVDGYIGLVFSRGDGSADVKLQLLLDPDNNIVLRALTAAAKIRLQDSAAANQFELDTSDGSLITGPASGQSKIASASASSFVTARKVTISPSSGLANAAQVLRVHPLGVPAGPSVLGIGALKSAFDILGSDFIADSVNYERMIMAIGATYIGLLNDIGGTGYAFKPIILGGYNSATSTLTRYATLSSNGVTAKLLDSGGQVYNVMNNAVGDGVTDDTSAISTAMDAAHTAGLPLFFPAGKSFVCSTISKSYGIRIIGNGATIIANTASSRIWTFTGSVGSAVLLTASAAAGDLTLTVASTAGLAAGDLLLVGDDVANFSSDPLRYRGTQVEILSVDSGTVLTIKDPLYSAFVTASNAFIKKVTSVTVDIRDLEFTNSSSTWLGGFLQVKWGRDVVLKDVNGTGSGASGVSLVSCYRFDVRSRARNYYDNEVTGLAQFGYGVSVAQASAHGCVQVFATRVRHAFSSGGSDNEYGEPNNIAVTGVANSTTSTSWDVHAQGYNIRFVNCHTFGSKVAAYQLRAPRCDIIGGSADECAIGVWLFDMAADITIKGLSVRRTRYVDTSRDGYGIYTTASVDGLSVQNCHFEDIALNCINLIASSRRIDIKGNEFKNYGQSVVAGKKRAVGFTGNVFDVNVTGNTAHFDDGISRSSAFELVGGNGSGSARCCAWNNIVKDSLGIVDSTSAPYWRVWSNMVNQAEVDWATVLTFADPLTIDPLMGKVFKLTLTGNITTSTISTPQPGQELELHLIQDATGGRTFAWPANVVLAGGAVVLSGASKRDVFTFRYGTATTNWYEVSRSLNL